MSGWIGRSWNKSSKLDTIISSPKCKEARHGDEPLSFDIRRVVMFYNNWRALLGSS